MVSDSILTAREERSNKINNLTKDGDVVCLKANVPGFDKNTPTSKAIVYYFINYLKKYNLYPLEVINSSDGVYALYQVANGKKLKKQFVKLEQSHALGRFIDIDVTLKNTTKSLQRKKLRKCFICNQPAFYCGRNKTHTVGELLDFQNQKTEEFFTSLLSLVVKDSMLKELNQKNKFGLVSKNTKGSHNDLNYKIMKDAINAIKTPLAQCFFIGLNANNSTEVLNLLRPIGLYCEEKMYFATKGANAYKGFIFIGGIILASIGYLINKNLPLSNLEAVIKDVTLEIDKLNNNDSFGYKAFHELNFGGIRKLSKSGFDVVINHAKINNKSILQTLIDIVSEIDDSVLLKRSGSYDKYQYYRNLISNVNVKDKKELLKVNLECVKNNISIGGSADVLIAVILLKKLREIFYLYD